MVLYNLTHNPSLQPSGAAIDLFEQTLLRTDRHHVFCHFHHAFENLWGRWLTDSDRRLCHLCHKLRHNLHHQGHEWIVMQSIPVFVVNHAVSGKEIFCPALQKYIPVPVDKFANTKIIEVDEPDFGSDDDRHPRDERKPRYVIEESSIVDVLGAFTVLKNAYPKPQPNDPFSQDNMPAIFIWMDKIVEAADSDEHRNMLFAKVVLHEFAHALMHIGEFCSDKFYGWREESLANAYALGKIKATGDTAFYDYAKDFVLQQDANYALGAKYSDAFDTDEIREFMHSWCRIKHRFQHIPASAQKDWMDYVQNTEPLDDKNLRDLDDAMFQ